VNMDAGSPRRPGINLDSSIHQSDAFPHTDETKPLTVHGGADIKSPARIVDVQMNFTRVFTQLHVKASYTAMLRGIVQGFL